MGIQRSRRFLGFLFRSFLSPTKQHEVILTTKFITKISLRVRVNKVFILYIFQLEYFLFQHRHFYDKNMTLEMIILYLRLRVTLQFFAFNIRPTKELCLISYVCGWFHISSAKVTRRKQKKTGRYKGNIWVTEGIRILRKRKASIPW